MFDDTNGKGKREAINRISLQKDKGRKMVDKEKKANMKDEGSAMDKNIGSDHLFRPEMPSSFCQIVCVTSSASEAEKEPKGGRLTD